MWMLSCYDPIHLLRLASIRYWRRGWGRQRPRRENQRIRPFSGLDTSLVLSTDQVFYNLRKSAVRRLFWARRLLVLLIQSVSVWLLFRASILLISGFVDLLVSGPARYGAKWTGLAVPSRSSILHVVTSIRPRRPSHIAWNSVITSVKSSSYEEYLLEFVDFISSGVSLLVGGIFLECCVAQRMCFSTSKRFSMKNRDIMGTRM